MAGTGFPSPSRCVPAAATQRQISGADRHAPVQSGAGPFHAGAGGGYLLTRRPEEYTVGEILRPLEGDLAPVECATDADFCERCGECVTVELWREIHRAVSQVVDRTTLADLVERYEDRQGEHRTG